MQVVTEKDIVRRESRVAGVGRKNDSVQASAVTLQHGEKGGADGGSDRTRKGEGILQAVSPESIQNKASVDGAVADSLRRDSRDRAPEGEVEGIEIEIAGAGISVLHGQRHGDEVDGGERLKRGAEVETRSGSEYSRKRSGDLLIRIARSVKGPVILKNGRTDGGGAGPPGGQEESKKDDGGEVFAEFHNLMGPRVL